MVRDAARVIAALAAKSGQVSFYLARQDQSLTHGSFTADCENFAALYAAEITTPIWQGQYDAAQALLKAGKYDEAIAAFAALEDTRYSAEQIKAAREAGTEAAYQAATALLAAGIALLLFA